MNINAALVASASALAIGNSAGQGSPLTQRAVTPSIQHTAKPTTMANHPYIGMWVTADGHIRQELLPNGRYDEARGARKSAYRGRYEVKGNHIDYWDDTGFTADGTFVSDDELRHGGMVFYREK